MKDEFYERIVLLKLGYETEYDISEDDIEEAVAEAAALLVDLGTNDDDLSGAAIWQQVADQTRTSSRTEQITMPLPEPWSAAYDEPQPYNDHRKR